VTTLKEEGFVPSRRNQKTGRDQSADSIVSTAVGAAEALSVGVLHLTERTLVEALHAVEDIGTELGSAVVRAARGSIKAAEEIGGDLVQVGKGVSRGVAEPARELGGEVARLATRLWNGTAEAAGAIQTRVRPGPAKAASRRGRRRKAA
jgi:hypothetical protein